MQFDAIMVQSWCNGVQWRMGQDGRDGRDGRDVLSGSFFGKFCILGVLFAFFFGFLFVLVMQFDAI